MKEFFRQLRRFVGRYKYLIVLVTFLLIVLFFDRSNIFSHMRNHRTLNELQEQIDYYSARCDSLEKELHALDSDGEPLERIAREKYGMHRDNEEVFIIR